jgi:hypothetical protein
MTEAGAEDSYRRGVTQEGALDFYLCGKDYNGVLL